METLVQKMLKYLTKPTHLELSHWEVATQHFTGLLVRREVPIVPTRLTPSTVSYSFFAGILKFAHDMIEHILHLVD